MKPTERIILFVLINCFFSFLCAECNFFWKMESEPGIERRVSLQANPGCNITDCRNLTIVYVKAEGPQDVLHHIWSFEGIPTFYYSKTSLESQLTIEWDLFLSGNQSGSFRFSKDPEYFAAVCLTKMIEFNDASDSGILPDDSDFKQLTAFNPEFLEWELLRHVLSDNETTATAVFHAKAFNGTGLEPSTNFQITLSTSGKRQRSDSLPHLMHTENSTQIDIVLDHIETVRGYPNARLALEFVTVVVDKSTNNFTMEETKSLDDEYTPGVFKLIQMLSPLKKQFLQWRPIAYSSEARDISDSTGLGHSKLRQLYDSEMSFNNSLLNWIQPDFDAKEFSNTALNITFGSQGDGFYKATNYTAWTAVLGYGCPATDELSAMILLVVAVGLGLPAFLVLVGGICVCVRQIKHRKDDLLLSN